MKKLHLLAIAMLSIPAMNASFQDENMTMKNQRQAKRNSQDLDNNFEFKKAKFAAEGKMLKDESPEWRLLQKALERKMKLVARMISQAEYDETFINNKDQTYKRNLKHYGRSFGNTEQAFLEFCKTASLVELAQQFQDMADHGEQFVE